MIGLSEQKCDCVSGNRAVIIIHDMLLHFCSACKFRQNKKQSLEYGSNESDLQYNQPMLNIEMHCIQLYSIVECKI
jgi:hypothetical protein